MRRFAGAPPFKLATYAYDRNAYSISATGQALNPNANYVAPVNTGGWAQLQWYWTDTLWTGVYYGQNRTQLSQARKGYLTLAGTPSAGAISAGAIERQQEWHVNFVYDPNPAIRLGLEYSWYESHYANNQYNAVNGVGTATTVPGGGLTSDGTVNTVRFSAQYFF